MAAIFVLLNPDKASMYAAAEPLPSAAPSSVSKMTWTRTAAAFGASRREWEAWRHPFPVEYFHEDVSGFPLPSLACYRDYYLSGDESEWWKPMRLGTFRTGIVIRDGNPLRANQNQMCSLPLVPVWPGFAVDVAFWGGLSWLLLFAPFTFRRFIRTRRNRCPTCGYDTRGLDTCPECGAKA
jgi:hypothetical protein